MHAPTTTAPERAAQPSPGHVQQPHSAPAPRPEHAPVQPPLTPYQARMAAHYAQTIGHYTAEQVQAIRRLYQAVRHGPDTGGGIRCAKFLLGLYNGGRFPFDLTDLRCLDSELYAAAMKVLHMDARHTWCEVHVLLEAIYADGRNVGAEFEHWAFNLRLPKRCKRDQLAERFGPQWPVMQQVPA